MIHFFDPCRQGPLRRDVRRRFANHLGTIRWWRIRYLLAHPQSRTLVFYRLGNPAAVRRQIVPDKIQNLIGN
jgi:hypothetical protein